MSYLGLPRLLVSGRFQADPSTVNYDPGHFDTATFKPGYHQPGQDGGWWNPGGHGAAVLTLKAGDPGRPRRHIGGQVHGVSRASGEAPPPVGSVSNPGPILSPLVWSGYAAPDEPDRESDVRPILLQYADLYPVMRPIVELSSSESVVAKRALIKGVFSVRMTDTRSMPVTRDLSRAKRGMILRWLDNPVRARASAS
jgi:hypothetical protein